MKWLGVWCVMMMSILASAQGVQVTIVDERDQAMPYVDVYTSDYSFAQVSDENGQFVLPHTIEDDQEVVISFLGYQQSSISAEQLRKNPLIKLIPGMVLDEVLMVGRTDNRSRDLPGKVESIDTKIFQLTNPQTAADALGQHADVFIQKSQMGGGSPIVRGFEANKVLLVLDGVRMNNAIYRSGHLQNAITVDNAMLERLEVLYGPGSLIYGSDAIGGVVHFRSKNPKLNFDSEKSISFFGNAYTRYATANNEKSAHVDFNIGGDQFGSLTSISVSDFGDLTTGSNRTETYPDFGKRLIYADRINGRDTVLQNQNPNKQIGTSYSQLDLMQKFLYQPSKQFRLIANLQYSTSTDVPRYDALSEPQGTGLRYAEWYYGPQNRFFSSIRTDINQQTSWTDKIILIAAYQRIDEDRIDRRFGSNNLDTQQEDVDVFSITADLHKYLNSDETVEVNYGAEFNYNLLSSTAFRQVIDSSEPSTSLLTRYPSGGSSTSNIAAYALAKKQFTKWDLFGGLRYSSNGLQVKYLRSDGLPWPEEFYDGINTRNNALSWSIGATTHSFNGWKISSQVSSAFRSPNIDDLAKIRVNNDEISVPNIDLGPEKSINGELTIAKQVGDHSQVSTTGFATQLRDAIIRADFTLPDGSTTLNDEGQLLRTVANINADRARVVGISINAKTSLFKKLTLDGSFNYIKGTSFDQTDTQTPLSHIPPVYGRFAAAYNDAHQKLSLNIRYNGIKPLSLYGGSPDNLENATPEGTPAWTTINLYYQRQINDHLSATIGLENLMDIHYRPFASGVSAPGRNIIIGVNGKF